MPLIWSSKTSKTNLWWYVRIVVTLDMGRHCRKKYDVVIWRVENVHYLEMGGSYKCVCVCAYKNASIYTCKICVLYLFSTSMLNWIEIRLYLFSLNNEHCVKFGPVSLLCIKYLHRDRDQCKMKIQSPCSSIIKNFMMARAED